MAGECCSRNAEQLRGAALVLIGLLIDEMNVSFHGAC